MVTLVIPTTVEDYRRSCCGAPVFFERLPVDQIVYVGPALLKEPVETDAGRNGFADRVSFLDENEVIPRDLVAAVYDPIKARRKDPTAQYSSLGGYYQQFLKMGYSRLCEGDYYLTWDADTLPLHVIDLFDADGRPYFDVKAEYHPTYFQTIKKLFGFGKMIEKSFVSEHMLFRKDFMTEMLSEIEALPIEGTTFWEKILCAIGPDNLRLGLSEFETFGTWVAIRHPGAYKIRNWRSLRNTRFFTDSAALTEDDIRWLAESFDAATFEEYQETNEELSGLFHDPQYRMRMTAGQFYQVICESDWFGDYVDGGLKNVEGGMPDELWCV